MAVPSAVPTESRFEGVLDGALDGALDSAVEDVLDSALENLLDSASEVRNWRYRIGGMELENTVHRDSWLAENTEFRQCINVAQKSMKNIYSIS